eukprot:886325-Pleurochrysis_carterae.AAC.1
MAVSNTQPQPHVLKQTRIQRKVLALSKQTSPKLNLKREHCSENQLSASDQLNSTESVNMAPDDCSQCTPSACGELVGSLEDQVGHMRWALLLQQQVLKMNSQCEQERHACEEIMRQNQLLRHELSKKFSDMAEQVPESQMLAGAECLRKKAKTFHCVGSSQDILGRCQNLASHASNTSLSFNGKFSQNRVNAAAALTPKNDLLNATNLQTLASFLDASTPCEPSSNSAHKVTGRKSRQAQQPKMDLGSAAPSFALPPLSPVPATTANGAYEQIDVEIKRELLRRLDEEEAKPAKPPPIKLETLSHEMDQLSPLNLDQLSPSALNSEDIDRTFLKLLASPVSEAPAACAK